MKDECWQVVKYRIDRRSYLKEVRLGVIGYVTTEKKARGQADRLNKSATDIEYRVECVPGALRR